MTDIFHMTTFVSIYQAGEGIYEQFDKVLVIDEGRQVYFGPTKDARRYFVDMGFKDYPRQTTADYLTGCTDPNERQYQKGRSADDVPSTSAAMAEYYLDSPVFQAVKVDIELYRKQLADDYPVEEFREAVLQTKGRGSTKNSSYTVSFLAQCQAIARRQVQLRYSFLLRWILI
jgi:ATP-binding cassette, subfamily G (WHITE), member 2, PDR